MLFELSGCVARYHAPVGRLVHVGRAPDSDLVIRSGMAYHVHSWLIDTGRGDHFLSDTVLVTDAGPEVLSPAPRDVRVLP